LRSTAASSVTSAESSANSPSLHRPSSTPLLLLLLVAYCVDAGVMRRPRVPLDSQRHTRPADVHVGR
jgi:hypothetical protein